MAEQDNTMGFAEDLDFEAAFLDWEKQQNVLEGEIVRGTVLSVNKDFVIVDIKYKSEGQIPVQEFIDLEGAVTVKAGDEIDVYVENRENDNGLVELSKEKADRLKIWDEIAEACENEELVEGVITARVKGGLTVDIGVKAFLPGSQVDLRPVRNLEKYIGQRFHFKVIKFNKKRGNIVLSRRALLEKQREALKSQTLNKLEVGMVVDGIVKNITEYGAFIDLGGIDGLLHITDMSYARVNHPSELFEVGQEVKVKVLKYDADRERVSLGLKQNSEDPWMNIEARYAIGQRVKGKVVSLTDYGAFIELEGGVEGLIHISEMSWTKRVKHPSKVLSLGDEVEAQILEIDSRGKRISLGMKQIEQNPWDVLASTYPVGTKVKGVVRNITNFGIFIGIEDGIDGLCHVTDLSWSHKVKHPAGHLQKGRRSGSRGAQHRRGEGAFLARHQADVGRSVERRPEEVPARLGPRGHGLEDPRLRRHRRARRLHRRLPAHLGNRRGEGREHPQRAERRRQDESQSHFDHPRRAQARPVDQARRFG